MSNQEFIDANKDTTVYFVSYYKYSFTYQGETSEGQSFTIQLGGDPDDIYTMSLSGEETVGSLVEAAGEIEVIF